MPVLAVMGQAPVPHSHESTLEFFKVNGSQPATYLSIQSSDKDFIVPDYVCQETLLINQRIDIQIEPRVLETAYIKAHNSTIPDKKFLWKFGDNQSATGVRNRHAYREAGSYIVSIYILSKQFDSPQLFKKLLLHILPNKAYRLPKAVVKVNERVISDHLHDPLKTSFKQPLQFEGTQSIPGSSRITEYLWDLSDKTISSEPKLTHRYNPASYNAKPILRVKDSHGFISDASVEIINLDTSSEGTRSEGTSSSAGGNQSTVGPYLIALAGLIIANLLFVGRSISACYQGVSCCSRGTGEH